MQIPLPDTVTHKRPKSLFSAEGIETAESPEIIDVGVRAQINPATSIVVSTAFGPAEVLSDLIYLEPIDSNGKVRDVRAGDWFVDEATGRVWVATQPGIPARNPLYFARGKNVYSHIEVRVQLRDVEDLAVTKA